MRRMYSKKQLEELISQMSGDVIEVTNVKQLTDAQCDGLKVGDVVAKKTDKQYHLYLVTYKQDKHGLCLSYFDASVVETQSYDYTNGHWVYNSEDKTPIVNVENAESGTIQDALGLDENGKLVKGAISGGTKLYKHVLEVKITNQAYNTEIPIVSSKSSTYNLDELKADLNKIIVLPYSYSTTDSNWGIYIYSLCIRGSDNSLRYIRTSGTNQGTSSTSSNIITEVVSDTITEI